MSEGDWLMQGAPCPGLSIMHSSNIVHAPLKTFFLMTVKSVLSSHASMYVYPREGIIWGVY